MKAHLFPLQNRGMARDNSISKTEEGLVFENRNIRLTANEHDTLLSVTNERGNRKVEGLSFSGTLLGWNVLDRYIILFTKDETDDHIYRVECKDDGFSSMEIYNGNLGFSLDNPIESVVDHETEDVMKIYWIDGKNPLRYLNFSDAYLKSKLRSGSLDNNPVFVFAGNSRWFDTNRQSAKRDLKVSIKRDGSGNSRANGTIQYFMTFYNKNGSETSFVYVSPLVYLSPDDHGGTADGYNTNRVVLTVDKTNLDPSFDYVRTYAIVRTSENGQPAGYIIAENKILTDSDMIIVDAGNYLSAYDPTALLFIGSREVIAGTMTHKDNTLFLGDLESIGNEGVEDIALKVKATCFKSNRWESNIVSFEISKDIDFNEESGFYSYDCQLKYPADKIMGFKGGEKYRFALQFRNENGTMTKAFWIGDKVNSLYPTIESGKIGRPVVRCKVPSVLMTEAEKYGFTSVRLMMAQASYADRSVLAQGIVNPTVFNMLDRSLNAPYAIPSWIARPKGGNIPFAHLCGMESSRYPYGEIQIDQWKSGDGPSPFIDSSVSALSLDEDMDNAMPMARALAASAASRAYTPVYTLRWNLYVNVWEVRGVDEFYITGETYLKFQMTNGTTTVGSHRSSFRDENDEKVNFHSAQDLYDYFDSVWDEWGCGFSNPVELSDCENAWNECVSRSGETTVGHSTIFKGGTCDSDEAGTEIKTSDNLNYKVSYNLKKVVDDSGNVLGVNGQAQINCYDENSKVVYTKTSDIKSGGNDYVSSPSELSAAIDSLKNEWNVNIPLADDSLCENMYYSAVASSESYTYQSSGQSSYEDVPDRNQSSSSDTNANDSIKYGVQYEFTKANNAEKDGVGGIVRVWFIDSRTGEVISTKETYIPVNYNDSGANLDNCVRSAQEMYRALKDVWDFDWKFTFDMPGVSVCSLVYDDALRFGVGAKTIEGVCTYGQANLSGDASDPDHGPASLQRTRFYVDESIVTLNSPEIEYENVNVDRNSGLKFRIVGAANVASVISDYDIEVSNQRMSNGGVVKMNYSSSKHKDGLVSGALYQDYEVTFKIKDGQNITGTSSPETEDVFGDKPAYYGMYMWHKSGSIINLKTDADSKYGDNTWAVLNRKVFANLRFCKYTIYGSNRNSWVRTPDDIRHCTGYNNQLYELKHDSTSCMYLNNVDKVIVGSTGYSVFYSTSAPMVGVENKMVPGVNDTCYDPILMRYRSSAHAVISLPKIGSSLTILPYLFSSSSFDSMNTYDKAGKLCGWNSEPYVAPSQDRYVLNDSRIGDGSYYLLIGELYMDYDSNPATDTRYGGTSESAVESNVFIPCSEFDTLLNAKNNGLVGKKGDTYFQRWDCVKTMPMGDKDPNSVIDIVSAMLETHVNIDGRTDIDRGTTKLASMDISNFGSINRAYSQTDNFISAYDLDDKYNLDSYPSSLTWTLEKHPADEIDEWTHITLASSLKLDGDKGRLCALRRFQNTIIAFQDRGISEVMFNSRVQLNTSDGTPVELANSGKVDGKRYITEKSGCVNKWSIAEGKLGIYFVDDINRNISLFNGQGVENLSRGGRFDSWMQNGSSGEIWKPKDGNRGFITHYDKVNSEVYFCKWGDDRYPCLVYSEPFGTFTSFYDYMNVPMMANTDRKLISFRDGYLWLQNEGFYGNFFGEDYPFYVTYRVNPDAVTDKIWTNLEYRSDFFEVLDEEGNSLYGEQLVNENDLNDSAYRDDVTFDTVNVWNEYQKTGDVPVAQACMMRDFYPDVRRKFRIWRMDIPRDASGVSNPLIQNRIRNPWIYLKLQKNSDGISRMVVHMHDVMVKYFTTE